MESMDVRMARLEEGMVRVHEKFDHAETRSEKRHELVMGKLDRLTDRHWQLYVKVAGIAALMTVVSKFIKFGG